MESNFGVLKNSAFLSTKILKIIEINNFFQQENQQFSKTVTRKTMPHYATHRKQGGLKPCLASAHRYCLDIREELLHDRFVENRLDICACAHTTKVGIFASGRYTVAQENVNHIGLWIHPEASASKSGVSYSFGTCLIAG